MRSNIPFLDQKKKISPVSRRVRYYYLFLLAYKLEKYKTAIKKLYLYIRDDIQYIRARS